MPRGIVERRVHQHHIDTVGSQVRQRQRLRRQLHIEHDHIGRNRIRGRIGAREPRQRRVDLDQHKIDAGDAPGDRQASCADAGAEIDHAIARAGRRRGRQQHGIMAGAMT